MSPPILTNRVFQPKFALWAAFVHLGALLLLPAYFSWGNLALGFLTACLTAYSLGIFHHMYLSHSSFRAHPFVANLGALLGTLSWRGPMAAPLRYVALHRVHHAYSDRDGDPHSPVHGIFHALLGWNWHFAPVFARQDQYLRWAGRHAKNPFFLFLDSHVHSLQLAWAALLFLGGGAFGLASSGSFDWQQAMGWMVYGVFAKTLFVIYLANMVDVINHGPGYRNYETKDQSTNSFVMAMVHLGGAISWHNNHHGRPGYFSVKRRWWEFDAHLLVLRALEKLRLASDIKVLDDREPAPESGPLKINDFLRQSPARAAAMVSLRFIQFLAPLALYLAFAPKEFGLLNVIGLAALTPISAIGLHNLALLGHEGTHFNLAKDKLTSSLLGTLFASFVPGHFNVGFALSHAAHHVWTNTEKDPDFHLFQSFTTLSQRLFGARRAASLAYFRATLAAAFGHTARLPGLGAREVKILAWFNLTASALLLSLYVGLGYLFGAPFVIFFALTYAFTYVLSALRPYFEHAGTDEQKYGNARTFSSFWLDLAFGGINYHLAHHLYPRVPAYRMKAFHAWLASQETFSRQTRVEEGRTRALLLAAARAPYGRRGLARKA